MTKTARSINHGEPEKHRERHFPVATCHVVFGRALALLSVSSGRRIAIATAISLLFLFTGWAHAATHTRTLLDMAGDPAEVPLRVEKIATIGPVPVLNSLVFAIGEGKRLVNGLPPFARKQHWRYQTVFAPHIAALPTVQGADYFPDMEMLIRVAPDVVLTMDRASAQALRRAGLPAIYLAWRQPEDVKSAVHLLGQLLDRKEAAERYVGAFDATLRMVGNTLHGVSVRPRVLFFNPARLATPLLISEWWIRAAGGESVTDDERVVESHSFTLEQLLAWDPDILIVSGHEEAEAVRREPRFAGLKAVRAGRILVAPCGAHTWGNRTSEQPLMVLWAAKQFHPALFADLDLVRETQRFYRDFFGVAVSTTQAREILDGGPRGVPVAN